MKIIQSSLAGLLLLLGHTVQPCSSQVVIAPEAIADCVPPDVSHKCNRFLYTLKTSDWGIPYDAQYGWNQQTCPSELPDDNSVDWACECGEQAPFLALKYFAVPICRHRANLVQDFMREYQVQAAKIDSTVQARTDQVKAEYSDMVNMVDVEMDIIRTCPMAWLEDRCGFDPSSPYVVVGDAGKAPSSQNKNNKKKASDSSSSSHTKLTSGALVFVAVVIGQYLL
mmetsp:Transcript_38631/g.46766  ORF Transcript_38631/g.46766 Transcript_38631/m.46766 type:complete len:225 (-) Transcript_38631:402-1076(-)|eukprot:CAMPEP_0197848860 /NCGR_PEP_ID=MMETSP1438-20131217/10270_1 /TAXON_ID=1461541 /ORGANISM="Pterosperma sp., Strain CCMP1384" /LENGTH=224 /DNA_ID=CAMNT_0043461293 /DNA_START=83 /DNA_END=757 /DNA_ORIENTATION=+